MIEQHTGIPVREQKLLCFLAEIWRSGDLTVRVNILMVALICKKQVYKMTPKKMAIKYTYRNSLQKGNHCRIIAMGHVQFCLPDSTSMAIFFSGQDPWLEMSRFKSAVWWSLRWWPSSNISHYLLKDIMLQSSAGKAPMQADLLACYFIFGTGGKL